MTIHIGGDRYSGQIIDRWSKIDDLDEPVFFTRRCHNRRITQGERPVARFLIYTVLMEQAVLAPEIPVVGIKHDKSIIEFALLLQLIQNILHRNVHGMQATQLVEPKLI